MDIKELSFELYVNCELEYTLFADLFKSEWKGTIIRWRKSGVGGETDENWIEIRKSHSRDPIKAKEFPQDQGGYYYPFIISAASKIKDPTQIDLDKQIAFLREIQKTLENKGCLTVVSSHFEHLL